MNQQQVIDGNRIKINFYKVIDYSNVFCMHIKLNWMLNVMMIKM